MILLSKGFLVRLRQGRSPRICWKYSGQREQGLHSSLPSEEYRIWDTASSTLCLHSRYRAWFSELGPSAEASRSTPCPYDGNIHLPCCSPELLSRLAHTPH